MRTAFFRCLTIFLSGWYALVVLTAMPGCLTRQNTHTGVTDTLQRAPEPTLYKIEINQMKFEPAILQVKKGDKVVFVNNDLMVHDVTEEHHRKWSPSPLKTREYWSLTVTESDDYFCSLHQVMKGKIVVTGSGQ